MIRRHLPAFELIACLSLIFASAGFAQSPPSLAPLNPDFENYIQAAGHAGIESFNGSHANGLIPEPINLSHLKGSVRNFYADSALPSSYDLRATSKLTPIRDQGGCGDCWAFATMGSLESFLMPNQNLNFSENNLKDTAGFDLSCCEGGNRSMSVAYLARWSGPVFQTDDPYNDASCQSPSNLTVQEHVQDVIYVPSRSGPTDNNAIKQAVMEYGAVYTTYYHDDSYFNSSTNSYFCKSASSANHAVCIVGWNDNYAASNFNSAPPGPGAFLIRNSWGTYWGIAGYFWMSYYDVLIGMGENAVFEAEPATNYDTIYQYDPLGWVSSTGYGATTAWFANVFTATSSSSVAAASWYDASPGSTYEVDVYTNPTSGPINASGPASVTTGTITDAGYHTVHLESTVPVTAGQKFSVVVKLTTPGYSYPVPIEQPYSGYSSGATASLGQSYMSGDGQNWTDVVSYYAGTNVCLKAFTSSSGATASGALSVSPNTTLASSGTAGGPFSPASASYTLTNTGQASIEWISSATQSWVGLSSTSGTLAAGASATVIVSINSAGSALAAGSYSDTVTFANTTNGVGNTTRAVALTVNAATPGVLSVTPATAFSSSGNVGGSFSPASQVYTLTNTGQSSINWAASATKPWVGILLSSGKLAGGASTTVTVSINASANTLAAGSYSDTVSFTNTTNGKGNGARAISLTVNALPGVLSVTPATAFVPSGYAGGPFTPTSQVYTLTNTGKTSIKWTAGATQKWVGLSASSGSLAAGGTATVIVSINSAANALVAGTYTDTVSFVNATNGNGSATRAVSLSVNKTPGKLSVSPATTLSASGTVGGPFSPSSQAYTLTNTGQTSINWTAARTQAWVGLSISAGTLAGGASATVIVSISSAGSALPAGSYSDTVTFANATNSSGTVSYKVNLSVIPVAGTYQETSAVFSWIDPTSHTVLPLTNSPVSAGQAMPFGFQFYGNTYTTLYVGSNGLMGFSAAGLNNSLNTDIPSASVPNAAIYPYWDYLVPSATGTVRIGTVGTAPNRKLVVSWVNVPFGGQTAVTVTFQAILCEGSNDIVFQYLNSASNTIYGGGRHATIGIENGAGTSACKYSYNQAGSVTNNYAIRFTTAALTTK